MKASDKNRAEVVWHLAGALQMIGAPSEVGGYVAPADVLMLLEHRLRAALREGPCPECPSCSLAAALEEATDEP